jgi:hypothetical protein
VDSFLDRVWLFIRGELPPRVFEAWICEEPSGYDRLGVSIGFDF